MLQSNPAGKAITAAFPSKGAQGLSPSPASAADKEERKAAL